jgi:hypothetical protein
MGGGLMQLVAYGAQDVYLTGNPQITFFKVVYRRHTNFACEVIEHTLNGNPDFGRRATVTITRNGDLITNMYLRVELDQVVSRDGLGRFGWVRRLGHALINSVEVEIGGARIDKQYGTWLDIWYELVHTTTKERGYDIMIGDVAELTSLDLPDVDTLVVKPRYTMYIPLQFWFCRNVGLALPLIALQYHEVRLHFEFTSAERLCVKSVDFTADQIRMREASLLVDYIYLDSEERRRYAQVGHEYLIEQLQFTGEESANQNALKVKLGFNHPVKELIWAIRNGNFHPSSSQGKAFLGYTNDDTLWDDALQEAADNIANNVFSVNLGTGGQADAPTADDYFVAVSDGNGSAGPDGPAGGEYDDTTIAGWEAAGGHAINLSVVDNAANETQLFLRLGVLTFGNVVLDSKVDAIEVEIFDDDGEPGYTAVALSHFITIHDLSVPVDCWTDNRTQTDLGVNPFDVRVWQWTNYGITLDGLTNPLDRAVIQLNGHDRFDVRQGKYFNYVQPYQHHTRIPKDGINIYSFALHPEQHQPSGTANLSRIDNTQLNLFFVSTTQGGIDTKFLNSDSKLYVYAHSYNVLRIMSGMGINLPKNVSCIVRCARKGRYVSKNMALGVL